MGSARGRVGGRGEEAEKSPVDAQAADASSPESRRGFINLRKNKVVPKGVLMLCRHLRKDIYVF